MPKSGYGNTEAENILCPLFKAITPLEIRCESHVPDASVVVIRFRSEKFCKIQKKVFCEGCWKRCEHYRAWEHMRWVE